MTKGPLTEIEMAAIRSLVEENKTPLEIKEVLGRSRNSSIVNKYINEIEVLFTQEQHNEETNSNLLSNWETAVSKTIEDLTKQGVPLNNAHELVKNALSKIDLNGEPSSKSIMSFVKSGAGNSGGARGLQTMKKWGRSTVVSSNEASSSASDRTGGPLDQNRSGIGGHIFKPNG